MATRSAGAKGRIAQGIGAGMLLMLAACGPSGGDAPVSGEAQKWVGAWMTAQGAAELPGYSDRSYRMIIHPLRGGHEVRLRFANLYGTVGQSVTLTDVHLGLRDGSGPDVVHGSQQVVTFGGDRELTLAAGAEAISDPLAFPLDAFRDVAVSFHVPGDTGPVSMHQEAHQTSYLTADASGSHAADESGAPFAATTASWYYLTGLDVRASTASSALVAFGDSITDGTGIDDDSNQRWPDVLAQRLADRSAPLSVLNAGIGGNRVLNDALVNYDPVYPFPWGASALHRLDRDVLDQAGVSTVILLEGINDIGVPLLSMPPSAPVTADDLIAGYREIIERSHARGLCIVGATLLPSTFLLHGEPLGTGVRQAVNAWIRDGAEWDGVIDFDAIARDPANPEQLRPEFDSGDGLHPNAAGYAAMGAAIDLPLLDCHR